MPSQPDGYTDDAPPPTFCRWVCDADGIYHTDCGHAFFFDTDGPVENQLHFCGYCGKRLQAEPHQAAT